jgi:hypothetical protein
VRIVVLRVFGAVAGGIAVVATLTGCLLPIDAAKPEILYTNQYDENVIVTVEGTDAKFETKVSGGSSYYEYIPGCVGTGIRVETGGGELLGRVRAQACPNWTLTINKDGSLDYVKD